MSRLGLLLSLFVVASAPNSIAAKQSELPGCWKLIWDNNSSNTITFEAGAEGAAVAHSSDAGDACPIYSTAGDTPVSVAFRLVWPSSNTTLERKLSLRCDEVTGDYRDNPDAKGEFRKWRR